MEGILTPDFAIVDPLIHGDKVDVHVGIKINK